MKRIACTLVGILSLGSLLVLPALPAAAMDLGVPSSMADAKSDVCAGLDLGGANGCGDNGDQVTTTIGAVINVLTVVVGIVAVVMVIIAGMNFITSGGESNKITKARMALIYAGIGLAVVALSQTITHFVLHTATATAQQPIKKTVRM